MYEVIIKINNFRIVSFACILGLNNEKAVVIVALTVVLLFVGAVPCLYLL